MIALEPPAAAAAAADRPSDAWALMARTGFFVPDVDDPFHFGRMAATRAPSEVCAVGGRPILALVAD